MSSHKIHGPKGVGALYIRKGTKFKPQIIGGHQEHKKRGGTENIPGIVGFAKAVTIINKEDLNRITELRDMMIEKLLEIPDTQLNGPKKRGRCCNNVNICFNFIEGESLVLHLDMAGIAVSTASACSNLELKASHVLLSIGLRADVAHGAIRFVLSKYTTKEDVLFVIEKTKEIVENLRKISPIKKGVNINEYIHCEDDDCHDACEYGKK